MACKTCETCLAYRKYLKFEQWQASTTSPTSTYLLAEFPTPDAAAYFAGMKGLLSRRERITKFSVPAPIQEVGSCPAVLGARHLGLRRDE